MVDDQEYSADDLALLKSQSDALDAEDGDGDDGGETSGDRKTEQSKTAKKAEASSDEPKGKTLASGREEPEEKPAKPAWREDWREEMARKYAAGDEKAYKKELRRLERYSDPTAVYGTARELEGKFDQGGLIRVPGKDAKPEEIEAFNKALGVPEKPDEYYKDLQLTNGAVVGEADKPFVDSFAQHVHKTGMRPDQFKAAMDWYYTQQQAQADQMDEEDDDFRIESEKVLKEEFGKSYKRNMNGLKSLFVQAEGGTDLENENSVYARLVGGRTADGRIIGNDPAVLKWLHSLRTEINPAASVVEDGDQTGKGVDDKIAEIEAYMKTNRRDYFKNEKMQNEYRQLLTVRDKIQARA